MCAPGRSRLPQDADDVMMTVISSKGMCDLTAGVIQQAVLLVLWPAIGSGSLGNDVVDLVHEASHLESTHEAARKLQ